MWWKLIFNSFRRDLRKKTVAMAAVMLATSLATLLLNWSFNLGDKLQHDLRAYGANILILPQGSTLPVSAGNSELGTVGNDSFLQAAEMARLSTIFWTNQIHAMAPLLQQDVDYRDGRFALVGTEFGAPNPKSDLSKAEPFLSVDGRWPRNAGDAVAGIALAQRYGWKRGTEIRLEGDGEPSVFRITGIVRSGEQEDNQLIARLEDVQRFAGRPGAFKQLLVSAVVTPENSLYQKHQENPLALTPKEAERFSCTPYISSVASDISKVFTGSEARIIRQVSQSEEKISTKVNWLMLMVTLAALVAASLTMASTTTAMIMEQRKELALMKAIGSQNRFILLYLLGEILLLGGVGSIAGYLLGSSVSVVFSSMIFDAPLHWKLAVLPVVAFVGILIILCGSFWPLRQATSLQPSVALKDL